MRLSGCLIVFFFAGCKPSTSTSEEALKEQERSAIENSYTSTDFNGCYWKVTGRDTVVAWLAQTENTITGKLNFDNFEKDGSTGTVHGTIEGDIAKLWYSFKSEGVESVMEIHLQKSGDTLFRGTGTMDNRADTSYFPGSTAVHFEETLALKTDCALVPDKYK